MNTAFTEKELNENYLFLTQLAKTFPTVEYAMTEIVNLSSILALPKPTEHFMSDLHGQGDAFEHILNNASGVIRREIERLFVDRLSFDERETLATIVYYPKQKLSSNWKTLRIPTHGTKQRCATSSFSGAKSAASTPVRGCVKRLTPIFLYHRRTPHCPRKFPRS